MSKIHFNPETGETGKCNAKSKCPFSGLNGSENHFNTEEEARAGYEKYMKDSPRRELNKVQELISQLDDLSENDDNPFAYEATILRASIFMDRLELESFAGDLEFENYNPNTDEDYITLENVLDNPELMSGNCGSVSWALEEELVNDFKQEDIKFSSHEIKFNDGKTHVANLMILPSGEKVIIDYTAKQYGEHFMNPYIDSIKNWTDTINNNVQKLYNTSISNKSIKELINISNN